MSSIQVLKDKRNARQEQYNLARARLDTLHKQMGYETDAGDRFKLENQIQQFEADLEQLGQEIDRLDQEIATIESGQVKLDDVLKQEGLETPAKPTTQPKGQLIAIVAAIAAIGLGGLTINGILSNSRSNPGTTSVQSAPSQSQTGLDSRFAGDWMTEGDIRQASIGMFLSIKNPKNDQLDGILTFQKGGEWGVSGKGQDGVVEVIIEDYRRPETAGVVGNAELRLEGDNLVWRLTTPGRNNFFPAKATLYRKP
jgi:hypothetical protein